MSVQNLVGKFSGTLPHRYCLKADARHSWYSTGQFTSLKTSGGECLHLPKAGSSVKDVRSAGEGEATRPEFGPLRLLPHVYTPYIIIYDQISVLFGLRGSAPNGAALDACIRHSHTKGFTQPRMSWTIQPAISADNSVSLACVLLLEDIGAHPVPGTC